MLNVPVTARKIRFEPVTGQGSQICTSLEVYRDDMESKFLNSVFKKLNACKADIVVVSVMLVRRPH